jgi:hypothetical protein
LFCVISDDSCDDSGVRCGDDSCDDGCGDDSCDDGCGDDSCDDGCGDDSCDDSCGQMRDWQQVDLLQKSLLLLQQPDY